MKIPAIWEGADDLAKKLNIIAPILVIVLALLVLVNIPPSNPFLDIFGGLFGTAGYGRGYFIARMIVGVIGGVIYFIPKIGPYQGIKNNEIYLWPEQIMTIIITGIAIYCTYWYLGAIVMGIQFLMVCILGSVPIWEAPKSR